MSGISHFIEYLRVERRYSAYTVQAYEQDLREFCSFLKCSPETWDASVTTSDDVRQWLVVMLDNGLSARSVRRKLSSLRSYYKFLLRLGKTDKDITRSVIAPKMHKPLPVFFKESEMEQAELQMEWGSDFTSLRDSLIIEMLYETGMRRAELLRLTDADIDFPQGHVRVFGKRNKERIIPFGERLSSMLRTYIASRNETFPEKSGTDYPVLLVGDKGAPLAPSALYRIVCARMGEVSSLKKHSPHVLRHTFATAMLNNGADINTIKDLLGHASLAATQVYTHTTFEQLRDEYRKAHPRAK